MRSDSFWHSSIQVQHRPTSFSLVDESDLDFDAKRDKRVDDLM